MKTQEKKYQFIIKNTIFLYVFLFGCLFSMESQTKTENYIKTKTFQSATSYLPEEYPDTFQQTFGSSELLSFTQNLGGGCGATITIENGNQITFYIQGGWHESMKLRLGNIAVINSPFPLPDMDLGEILDNSGNLVGRFAKVRDGYLYLDIGTYVSNPDNSCNTTITKMIPGSEAMESVSYYDGLGRTKQTIALESGGNGEDLVTPIVYDAIGRKAIEYLPYSSSVSSLNFMSNSIIISSLQSQYLAKYPDELSSNNNPYSQKGFDGSPFNRVIEEAAPGSDWSINNGRTIKSEFTSNENNEILQFDVSFIGNNAKNPKLELINTYYNQSELYKTITKDENWTSSYGKDRTTEEFTNKEGQVLLKRTYNNQVAHDTYYVYDDFGNLTYVLPPLAAEKTKVYEETSLTIPSSTLSSYSSYSSLQVGLRQTAPGNFEIYSSVYISAVPFTTLKTGFIADVPFVDNGVYYYLGGISSYSPIYYSVSYYIQDQKLYCSAYGSPGAFININKQAQFELPQNLQGYTQVETDEKLKELLDKLCYQYIYDEQNRLIGKKLPAKGWEYIVYDKLDRPILTQDSVQRAKPTKEWLFTKHDALGRVVYTGYTTNNSDRTSMQNYADTGSYTAFEKRETFSNTIAGIPIYYSNTAIPTGVTKVYTVNYYDTYTDLPQGMSGPPSSIYGQTVTANTQGLGTVSKVRVLDTDDWITTVTCYDEKARPIYVYTYNEYLQTTDITQSELDFSGNVLRTRTLHMGIGRPSITIHDFYTYDHQNRLLTHKQQINSEPEELIVSNHYNEFGQLIQKDVGNSTSSPLQQVNHAYNIRGWLKKINDPFKVFDSELFAMELHYNDYGTRLYNGNISAMHWKTATDNALRRYNYYYDDLNRITRAYYYLWSQSNRYSLNNVSYDKNGNIQSLSRMGTIVENPDKFTSSHFGTMDNLTYAYEGNQLLDVNDSANTTFGFKDGSNTDDDYTYDGNGNMEKDLNKGISSIAYNHLNLPTRVVFSSQQATINYVYDALGTKIRKTVSGSGLPTTTTDYSGDFVYQNDDLQFISNTEGYATPDGLGDYDYIYHHKDHLGNIRLSYMKNPDYVETSPVTVFDDGLESSSGWTGNAVITTDRAHTGQKSVKIVNDQYNQYFTSHSNTWIPISNTSDTQYTLSGWYYSNNPKVRLALFMKTNEETGYFTYVKDTGVKTTPLNQWVYLEFKANVPAEIDKLNFRIETHGGNAGAAWFDDLKIVRGNPVKTITVEESNYYPFGLKHKGYNNIISSNGNSVAQKKLYNGKELQDELNLNWYDFGARNYDAPLGRWMNIDPLADDFPHMSTYAAMNNNPLYWVDPDGKENIPALIWAARNMANKGIPFGVWYSGNGGWTFNKGKVPTETVCYESCWTAYMNGADTNTMQTLKTGFSTQGGGFKGRSHDTGGMNWFKEGDGSDRRFVKDIRKGELGDIVFMGEVGDMAGHATLLASDIKESTAIVNGKEVKTMLFYVLTTGSDTDSGNYGGELITWTQNKEGKWIGSHGEYEFKGFGQMTNIKSTDEQRKEAKKLIEGVKKGN